MQCSKKLPAYFGNHVIFYQNFTNKIIFERFVSDLLLIYK